MVRTKFENMVKRAAELYASEAYKLPTVEAVYWYYKEGEEPHIWSITKDTSDWKGLASLERIMDVEFPELLVDYYVIPRGSAKDFDPARMIPKEFRLLSRDLAHAASA